MSDKATKILVAAVVIVLVIGLVYNVYMLNKPSKYDKP